jgi:hypothetical protein
MDDHDKVVLRITWDKSLFMAEPLRAKLDSLSQALPGFFIVAAQAALGWDTGHENIVIARGYRRHRASNNAHFGVAVTLPEQPEHQQAELTVLKRALTIAVNAFMSYDIFPTPNGLVTVIVRGADLPVTD